MMINSQQQIFTWALKRCGIKRPNSPKSPFSVPLKSPPLYLADRNKAYLNSNQLFPIQRDLLSFIIDSCAFFRVPLS